MYYLFLLFYLLKYFLHLTYMTKVTTLAEAILQKPNIILQLKHDYDQLLHQNQKLSKEVKQLRTLLKESIAREEDLDLELRVSIIREEKADTKIEHLHRELDKLTDLQVHHSSRRDPNYTHTTFNITG